MLFQAIPLIQRTESGLTPFSESTGWLGRALDLAKIPGRSMSLDMPLILRAASENDNFFPASIRKSGSLNTELIDMISMHRNHINQFCIE